MDNNEYIDFFNKNVCPYVKDFEKIRMNYLSAFVLIYVFAAVIFIYMLVKLDIVHYYKDKINGEFKNQKLYIIISSAKNWFEIPFFKPANTPLVFYQPVNDLKNLLSIVDSVLS